MITGPFLAKKTKMKEEKAPLYPVFLIDQAHPIVSDMGLTYEAKFQENV